MRASPPSPPPAAARPRAATMGSLMALAFVRVRGRFAWVAILLLTLPVALWMGGIARQLGTSTHAEARAALTYLPLVTAKALLWGPGIGALLLTSLDAWRRDHRDGLLELLRAAGATPLRYRVAHALVLVGLLLTLQLLGALVLSLFQPSAWSARAALEALGTGVLGSVLCALLGSVTLASQPRVRGYLLLLTAMLASSALLGASLPQLLTRVVREGHGRSTGLLLLTLLVLGSWFWLSSLRWGRALSPSRRWRMPWSSRA